MILYGYGDIHRLHVTLSDGEATWIAGKREMTLVRLIDWTTRLLATGAVSDSGYGRSSVGEPTKQVIREGKQRGEGEIQAITYRPKEKGKMLYMLHFFFAFLCDSFVRSRYCNYPALHLNWMNAWSSMISGKRDYVLGQQQQKQQ